MLICDTHCDTLYTLSHCPGNQTDVTIDRMKAGGVSLQTMAMFVGSKEEKENPRPMFERMLLALSLFSQAGARQLDDPSEAREGEPAVMLSIEGCEIFNDSLSVISEYREKGLRMAAITWNYENALGVPACAGKGPGLSEYGVRAVKEMQRLKIAADVSHLNEAGFYDILNKTDAPPLASHSCCAAIKPHVRNLSDAQLKALFHAGGYVGVNFYPGFLCDGPCGIDTVIDHIAHMFDMGGEGKVGFGSDFDGIEKKPEGLNDPSDLPKIIARMRERGFTQAQIEGVAGFNLLRYYERI